MRGASLRRAVFGGVLAALMMVASASVGVSKEHLTAANVTESGRSLDRAIRVSLGSSEAKAKRSVVFLIDPTPTLKSAGFEEVFARELGAALRGFEALSVGLAFPTTTKLKDVAPTRDAAALELAVSAALKSPKNAFRNLYAECRRAATGVARGKGKRSLILVSLDNADTEDDVEATASVLKKNKITLSCITREAYVSDSYYASGRRKAPPGGMTTGYGDGPFLTLPWGWILQGTNANETTPSGFAHWGFTRMATVTGGRVFLYSSPGGVHQCAYLGSSCLFCNNKEHLPTDDYFQQARLNTLAPLAHSRNVSAKSLAQDPAVRLVLKTWLAASKAGLLRSRPSAKIAGSSLKPERRLVGSVLPLTGSSFSYARLAVKADKALKVCDKIIAQHESELEGLNKDGPPSRSGAMADHVRAMLYVTRTNLIGFSAWCREVAPVWAGKEEVEMVPPEAPFVSTDRRPTGISSSSMCLCHGVKPFMKVKLPGGKAWKAALFKLDGVYSAYMKRYAHTPYAMALRHQGLARYFFTYPGKGTPPPKQRPSSKTDEAPTTEASRPNRTGGGSGSTGSSGPTTGGG